MSAIRISWPRGSATANLRDTPTAKKFSPHCRWRAAPTLGLLDGDPEVSRGVRGGDMIRVEAD